MKLELTASELKELMDNSNQETQADQELGNLRIELAGLGVAIAGQIQNISNGSIYNEELLTVLNWTKDIIDNVMENKQ